MTAILEVGIDARGAQQGARVVRRSFDQVEEGARRLEQRSGRTQSSLDQFRGAVTRAGESLGRMREQLRMTNPLMGAFAGALSVGAVVNFTRQTIALADAVGTTANRVGVTTAALQELRFAGELAGVQASTLDMGLQRLTRRLGEAAMGTGELKDTLDQYGIAIRDANGRMRDTEDVLADLADVMKNADSDAERLRIAFKAFDSEGVAMINMLRDGSAALDDMRQEARDLGLVFDREMIEGAARLNSELTKLNSVIRANLQQGLLRTLVTDSNDLSEIYTNPAFQEGMQRIAGFIGAIGREALATATSLGALVEVLKGDFSSLGDVGLLGVSKRMLESFGLLGEEAENATGPVSSLGTAMRGAMEDAASGLAAGQEMLASLDGKGGMADRVGNVVAQLQRQNERLSLMQQAMEQGQDAVEGLNTAFAIYDELLAAGVIPATMSLYEAMQLTAEGGDENARAIAILVKENERLEKSLEKTRSAHERLKEAANDNARQQAEAQRQQAAPMQAVAPEVAEYAADLLAAIFAEEAAA